VGGTDFEKFDEAGGSPGGAADKQAIGLRDAEQLGGVRGIDTATVENSARPAT
jgi:hypothetical protein